MSTEMVVHKHSLPREANSLRLVVGAQVLAAMAYAPTPQEALKSTRGSS